MKFEASVAVIARASAIVHLEVYLASVLLRRRALYDTVASTLTSTVEAIFIGNTDDLSFVSIIYRARCITVQLSWLDFQNEETRVPGTPKPRRFI